MDDLKCVVTLVHGTFASRAMWCLPNSRLAVALSAKLGSSCVLRAYPWSGKNSHTARLEAGRKLAEHLTRLTEEFPDSAHFVVAHSHGGNVALYALRDAHLQQKVRGVVCMATPFLNCVPRDLTKSLGFLDLFLFPIAGLIAMLLVSLVMLVFAWLLGLMDDSPWPEELWWMLLGFSFLTFITFVFALHRYLKGDMHERLYRRVLEKQTRVLELYNPPLIESTRILTVSTPLDEAGAVLYFWRFLSSLPFRLWQPELVLFLCLSLEALLWLSLLMYGLRDIVRELKGESLAELGLAGVAGTFGGVFLALLIPFILFVFYAGAMHALMFLAPRLIRSHYLAFGAETLWDNLLVDIGTATTAYAFYTEDIRRWVPRFAKRFRLRWGHAVYDDEQSVQRISEWIAATTAAKPLEGRWFHIRDAANPLGL